MKKETKKTIIIPLLTKIMLVAGFLLTFVQTQAEDLVYSNGKTFTFDLKNVTVKTVFDEIERQSEFIFIYRTDLLDTSQKVSIKAENQPVTWILDHILKNSSITYEINNRQIILKKEVVSKQATARNRGTGKMKTVHGIITDEYSEPIIGATVMLKGTTAGTTSDIDGNFSISCHEGDSLSVSFIGYENKVIVIRTANIYTITLKEASEELGEVVVTAFGTGQKKETMVGSVQTIRPGDLRVPSSSLSTSFAGRLAGVVAYQGSGQPGSNGANFYIRGISTLNGITDPLIVLDGVEISSGDLNNIDPEVIESFSILKDATATAMYGTRGANGVMIIKTKSGTDTDKPIIGFRIEGNIKQPLRTLRFVDGPTYMSLFNEAISNQQTTDTPYSDEVIAMTASGKYPYLFPNVDWYNEIFKDYSFNQKANFNIRGGTSRITYFMNVAMNHETGMLKNRSKEFYSYDNNYNIYNFSFQNNIDFHLSKTSTIALHLNVNLNDGTQPSSSMADIYNSFLSNSPVDAPVYFPNNDVHGVTEWVKWGAFTGGNTDGATNPVEKLTHGYLDHFSSTINANLTFDQKLDFITKGLSFKALFSFKNYTRSDVTRSQSTWNKYAVDSWERQENGEYKYSISSSGTPTNSVLNASFSNSGDRRMYFQTYLDYTRTFGKHSVNSMLLFNLDSYSTNVNTSFISSLPHHKIGYAFRASYDYDHRYMAEFNAGYNGSENFAKGHRFGFFPSFAIGWNISNEKFWESLLDIISNLKLRASYGLVGNDQIGADRFIYMSDLNLTGGNSFRTGYDGQTISLNGPEYIRYQNNNITWEVGKKLNVGADIQLFGDLNLTLDFFKERREHIFQKRATIPLYYGTGETAVYGNFATVENKGLDFSVDYGKQITKDFSMQFKGTFTFATNKIVEYDEPAGTRQANSKIGHSVNQIYGYVADGLYKDEADVKNHPESTLGNIAISPGDIKYVDQPNNDGIFDGKIDTDDKVAMGHPTVPEIVYGFGPTMAYKNWDLSVFFQGVARRSFMINAGSFAPFGTLYHRNVASFITESYWSKENPDVSARYPRLTVENNNHNNQSSSYWLRNGAFLKLKNIEIGYSFKRIRLYIAGENLLTFSPFKEWDPEMGASGATTYPNQRVFSLGIQMTFNK